METVVNRKITEKCENPKIRSTANRQTKSTIPLVAVYGKPSLTVNNQPVEAGFLSGTQNTIKLRNTGNYSVRVYLAHGRHTGFVLSTFVF